MQPIGHDDLPLCSYLMNDYLAALKLFVRVARRGSFSAAGRDLNIPQPTVSRIISSLEQEVGVLLINRTTRAVSLTEAGTEFLERLDPILAALERSGGIHSRRRAVARHIAAWPFIIVCATRCCSNDDELPGRPPRIARGVYVG